MITYVLPGAEYKKGALDSDSAFLYWCPLSLFNLTFLRFILLCCSSLEAGEVSHIQNLFSLPSSHQLNDSNYFEYCTNKGNILLQVTIKNPPKKQFRLLLYMIQLLAWLWSCECPLNEHITLKGIRKVLYFNLSFLYLICSLQRGRRERSTVKEHSWEPVGSNSFAQGHYSCTAYWKKLTFTNTNSIL